MNAEDALRAALAADAERFTPSPGAWADNQRRVRRRTRARRVTVAAVTAAGLGATGAVAVAWPRSAAGPEAVRPAAPSGSASASAPAAPAFTPPDLHGMSQADADALAQRCLESFEEERLPEGEVRADPAGRVAPASEYRLIFVAPAVTRPVPAGGDAVALYARGQVVTCETTSAGRGGLTHDTRLVPGWLKQPVVTWGSGGGNVAWRAYGVASAEVARVEVQGAAGERPVPAVLDNGFWVASGPASGTAPRSFRYPQATAYDRDGRVLHRTDMDPVADCYRLPDGRTVDTAGAPTEPPAAQRCEPGYAWP